MRREVYRSTCMYLRSTFLTVLADDEFYFAPFLVIWIVGECAWCEHNLFQKVVAPVLACASSSEATFCWLDPDVWAFHVLSRPCDLQLRMFEVCQVVKSHS